MSSANFLEFRERKLKSNFIRPYCAYDWRTSKSQSHSFFEVSKYDWLYILLEQRGKVCKQLPIGWQKTKRRTALYTSLNKLIRQKNIYWSIVIIISLRRTKQVLKTGSAAMQVILLSYLLSWHVCRITYPYQINVIPHYPHRNVSGSDSISKVFIIIGNGK